MTDPVAIVTGAANGIGRATADRFVSDGYRVVGIDILEATLGGPGGVASAAYQHEVCDISDEEQVGAVVQRVTTRWRRIDALVNVAGVVLVKPLEETSWLEFRRTTDVNLGGTFLLCKYVIPAMKRQRSGVIVNVASVSGHVGQIDHALYGATKGGVIALTRALSWELAGYGIRVNSVSPGSVDTPMLRHDVSLEAARTGMSEEEVRHLREGEQALGRWADPREIANAISFLTSAQASFITGTDLLVDAGWVAR
jgi:NAD(P)-dependent dehydrogenase (short-subunit alcohol dehydrogenase family)